jgi:hypothetical protein
MATLATNDRTCDALVSRSLPCPSKAPTSAIHDPTWGATRGNVRITGQEKVSANNCPAVRNLQDIGNEEEKNMSKQRQLRAAQLGYVSIAEHV